MLGYFQDLELGGTYTISCRLKNGFTIKTTGHRFIQVTSKGFNFLDVKNNRCIFNRHFYRSKKNNKYLIVKNLKIIKE
jgi:hypothetical protein